MTKCNGPAMLFYRALSLMTHQRLTPDVGGFRLFSRRAVLAICSIRERHRYMRGIATWLGLKEAVIPFEREARAAGLTHYSLFKLLRFAWTWISSFAAFPLWISIAAGCIFSCAGFLYLFASCVSGALDECSRFWMGLSRRPGMCLLGDDPAGAWSCRRLCRSHA